MSVLDEQQVADQDLAADHELEVSAQLARVEEKVDRALGLLERAEPLLKLAEGWARFRGFGRG